MGCGDAAAFGHIQRASKGAGRVPLVSTGVTTRRQNCFDFLRLFAAVGVVVSHATDHIGGPVLWVIPGSTWSELWFYDGVPMFFIISGYLVYKSALRCKERGESMWQFGWNRTLRIVPALLVWAAATAALWGGTGYYAPNWSLWTIPAECSFFYVAVPVMLWLTDRLGWPLTFPLLLLVAAGDVGLGVAYDLAPSTVLQLALFSFVPWTAFFLIGMLSLRYEDHIPLRAAWALVALALYILLRAIDVLSLQAKVGDRTLEYAGALPLSYLIFFIAYRGPAVLARIPDAYRGPVVWGLHLAHVRDRRDPALRLGLADVERRARHARDCGGVVVAG